MPGGTDKFCIGRWLGIVALAEDECALIDFEEPAGPDRLLEEARAEADRDTARESVEARTAAALREGDTRAMPTFLESLVTSVRNAGASPGLKRHADALERRIAAYVADPSDFFTEMLDAVYGTAAWFYEHQGFPVNHDWVRYELGVARKGSPHKLPMGAAVGGGLRVARTGVAVAKVGLTADRFWRPEICAIPYVLMHELVVHAFAAPDARDSGDGFAEGWMDFVAYDLYGELVWRQLDRRLPLGEDFPPRDQVSHADLLHTARTAEQELIAKSKFATEQAWDVLRRKHGDARAREMMWAFSAAMNRSPVIPAERTEACEQLGRALDAGAADTIGDWIEVAAAIHARSDGTERIRLASEFAQRLCKLA